MDTRMEGPQEFLLVGEARREKEEDEQEEEEEEEEDEPEEAPNAFEKVIKRCEKKRWRLRRRAELQTIPHDPGVPLSKHIRWKGRE